MLELVERKELEFLPLPEGLRELLKLSEDKLGLKIGDSESRPLLDTLSNEGNELVQILSDRLLKERLPAPPAEAIIKEIEEKLPKGSGIKVATKINLKNKFTAWWMENREATLEEQIDELKSLCIDFKLSGKAPPTAIIQLCLDIVKGMNEPLKEALKDLISRLNKDPNLTIEPSLLKKIATQCKIKIAKDSEDWESFKYIIDFSQEISQKESDAEKGEPTPTPPSTSGASTKGTSLLGEEFDKEANDVIDNIFGGDTFQGPKSLGAAHRFEFANKERNKANELFDKGNYQKALVAYEEALRLYQEADSEGTDLECDFHIQSVQEGINDTKAKIDLFAKGIHGPPAIRSVERKWLKVLKKKNIEEFKKRPELIACHGIAHSRRLWKTIKRILRKYPTADAEVLIAACFLHDIGTVYFNQIRHGDISAERAKTILETIGFPEEKIDKVLRVIREHDDYTIERETIESQLLFFADTKDAFGRRGAERFISIYKTRDIPDGESPALVLKNIDKRLNGVTDPELKELLQKPYNIIKKYFIDGPSLTQKFGG
ncbi:HD domain-containing protein, partial [bacterium]|nr:HD domain-containing protein [bacterium]